MLVLAVRFAISEQSTLARADAHHTLVGLHGDRKRLDAAVREHDVVVYLPFKQGVSELSPTGFREYLGKSR